MQMPDPDERILSLRDQILGKLRAVLPKDAVISDPAETRAYECDALTAYRCPPLAVVLPRAQKKSLPSCGFATLRRFLWCHGDPGPRSRGGRCPLPMQSFWACRR